MNRIEPCNQKDYQTLVDIWERSVRATHEFLTEYDIMEIRDSLIAEYFKAVCLYVIYDEKTIAGFIGLDDHNIEMLFIDPICMGKGLGTRLIEFAISLGADLVDVNEQNPRALGFYQTHGFRIVKRDEYDSNGRPFPILHLKL
nr:GNAT family N-acetyltransferase [Bacteroides intestinalis]